MVSLPFAGRFPRRRANAFTPVNILLTSAFQGVADLILRPSVLLPAIAFLSGASPLQIAAFATATGASWAIAPFVLGGLRRVGIPARSITITASVIRLISVVGLFILASRFDSTDADQWLVQLLWLTSVYHASNALTSQSATPAIARAVAGPMRLRIFRIRRLTSLLASLGTALVAWSVLRADAMTLDLSVERLLVLAAIAVAAASWFLIAIPDGGRSTMPAGRSGSDVALGTAWSRRPVRRYLVFRWLLGIATAGDVFLIVHGIRELDLTLPAIGEALVWLSIGYLVGNVLWTGWARAFGSRAPLQISALLHLFILLCAVLIPTLVTTSPYTDRFDSPDVAARAFAALFGVLGLAVAALAVANGRYLRDVTSAAELAAAVRLTNASMAVLGFAPLGIAMIVDRVSLERVLIGLAVAAFIALLASGVLSESRSGFRRRA